MVNRERERERERGREGGREGGSERNEQSRKSDRQDLILGEHAHLLGELSLASNKVSPSNRFPRSQPLLEWPDDGGPHCGPCAPVYRSEDSEPRILCRGFY